MNMNNFTAHTDYTIFPSHDSILECDQKQFFMSILNMSKVSQILPSIG